MIVVSPLLCCCQFSSPWSQPGRAIWTREPLVDQTSYTRLVIFGAWPPTATFLNVCLFSCNLEIEKTPSHKSICNKLVEVRRWFLQLPCIAWDMGFFLRCKDLSQRPTSTKGQFHDVIVQPLTAGCAVTLLKGFSGEKALIFY